MKKLEILKVTLTIIFAVVVMLSPVIYFFIDGSITF